MWLLDCMVRVCKEFWKKLPNCFIRWLSNFAFPSTVNESSYCPTSLSAFGLVSLLDFGHSSRFIVVSYCCFLLNFPNNIRCGSSFHMLTCHLNIFFVGCLPRSFTQFLIRFFFFLVSFKSSLYIFYNCPLSDVSLQIFSPSLWLSSHSLTVSFIE